MTSVDRVEVPLGQPPLRVWELNENSTRYDRLVAAPSDETMKLMWIIWAPLFGLIALYSLTVLSSILCNKRVLKSPFNLYLVFLMIPDVIYTGSCAIGCFLNYRVGHFSPTACRMQSMYLTWGAGSNTWINVLVAYEIRKLLRSSHIRQHYFPPTRKQVVIKCLIAYVYVAILAFCGLGFGWISSWLPHTTLVASGIVCTPLEYNVASSVFFWLVFVPAFVGIPFVYVAFVIWDVLYHKLMPPRGKRRMLAIYFFRIVVAFFIMWLPNIVFFYGFQGFDPWVAWASGTWGHLQGLVSTTVSLMKPDIAQATREFVTCRSCRNNPKDEETKKRSSWSSLWSARSLFGRTMSLKTDHSSQTGTPANSQGPCAENVTPFSNNGNGELGDQLDDTSDTAFTFQQCRESYCFLDEKSPDPSILSDNEELGLVTDSNEEKLEDA